MLQSIEDFDPDRRLPLDTPENRMAATSNAPPKRWGQPSERHRSIRFRLPQEILSGQLDGGQRLSIDLYRVLMAGGDAERRVQFHQTKEIKFTGIEPARCFREAEPTRHPPYDDG